MRAMEARRAPAASRASVAPASSRPRTPHPATAICARTSLPSSEARATYSTSMSIGPGCRERQAAVARVADRHHELKAATPECSADANSITGAQPPRLGVHELEGHRRHRAIASASVNSASTSWGVTRQRVSWIQLDISSLRSVHRQRAGGPRLLPKRRVPTRRSSRCVVAHRGALAGLRRASVIPLVPRRQRPRRRLCG
jgi:hypothetical protein